VGRRLVELVDRCKREDAEMVALAKDTAAQVARQFEQAIERHEITWEQLWDVDYRIINDSDPPQFTTKFLALCDRILPAIQEPLLDRHQNITFTAAVDRNGYLPTHNLKYSLPQRPGEKAWNTGNCRNRRIFDDRTGLAAARNRQPILVQTYRRDMGGGQFVSMKDISAPIMIHGQHWGGYRIGCRF
jgi:methyl-accepting chemotaxis protein